MGTLSKPGLFVHKSSNVMSVNDCPSAARIHRRYRPRTDSMKQCSKGESERVGITLLDLLADEISCESFVLNTENTNRVVQLCASTRSIAGARRLTNGTQQRDTLLNDLERARQDFPVQETQWTNCLLS